MQERTSAAIQLKQKRKPKSTTFIDAFVDFSFKSLTPEERDMYNASLKRKWDNKNVLDYAVKTAEQKARKEERIKMALKLLAKNTSIDEIAELTGLTIEEIEML